MKCCGKNLSWLFLVFSRQKMAQIEQKFEWKINRIDSINDQITKDYFDKIIIDQVIGSENERDLSNPGFNTLGEFLKNQSIDFYLE